MKYRIYTIVNIVGLTIGLTSTILIYLYIDYELSYDKFHHYFNQIYRVGVRGTLRGTELNQAITAYPMADALSTGYPDIIHPVRVGKYGSWLVSYKNKSFNEDNLLFADSTFFEVFTFIFLKGDAKTSLSRPKSIVLTESAAKKYFIDEDPLGKFLRIETDTTLYKVTGIIKDIPSNSHFHFDMLASLLTLDNLFSDRWISHNVYTYLMVKPKTDIALLTDSINNLVPRHILPRLNKLLGLNNGDFRRTGNSYSFFLQPLSNLHLKSGLEMEQEQNGNMIFIYVFSILAIFILITVVINIFNLSTARAIQRLKEIGVKKIMGSGRIALIRQFITESVLLSILGVSVSLLLVEIILPGLNRFMNLNLSMHQLSGFDNAIIILSFSVIVGILAGSYPSIFLASFAPVTIFKKKLKSNITGIRVRKILVLFQFFVAITCITTSFVLYSQHRYLTGKDLGFDQDNLLIIRRSDVIGDKIGEFKQRILKNNHILSLTYSNSIPGKRIMKSGFILEDTSSENSYILDVLFVGADFFKTYGIGCAEGRFFSSEIPDDSSACILNETAVRQLNMIGAAGKTLRRPVTENSKTFDNKIIGVAKDFNYSNLDKNIGPLVIFLMPAKWEGYFTLRLDGKDLHKTLAFLKNQWADYTHICPFISFMLNNDLSSNYRLIENAARIITLFSIVSLLMACLGLYGLFSYLTNTGRKELAVRKVFGAPAGIKTGLFFRQSVLMVAVSAILSAFVSWLVAKWWLADYCYHVTPGPLYIVCSTIIVSCTALLIMLIQILFSKSVNTGEILRYE